jgi:hypothetical protein
MINQLLTQNYQQQLCRTIEEVTDFVDMDFTEMNLNSSEDYERRLRRTSFLVFRSDFLKPKTMYLASNKAYG